MNVKKFSATSSREALRLVRESLGPDAVILSNRTVEGLVEILALAGDDMASLSEPVTEQTAVSMATLASLGPKRHMDDHQAANLAQTLENARVATAVATATAAATAADPSMNAMAAMMEEIRSMRGMLEAQLAEISFTGQQKREPVKSGALRELLASGFSPSLSRYLIDKMPSTTTVEEGLGWIKTILARNLATVDNESEILEQGGVFALVGPTGVGKTTTTAKLAARCVMRHGAGKLALITTDGYRIGGYEQLRIYGKILGVMVHSVKDESDLKIALEELKGKHTVLIDTVGMSQRDQMVGEQVAMLQGAGTEVKRLLCLSATSTAETLNEVVRAYQGSGLAGCIMTKLDEAATIGNVLDVVIRQKLNLYYVANGQRVPEDLQVANQQYLVDRAFKLKRETAPFQYHDDELPVVMANAARAVNDKSVREVHLG
jgi:flagellar biosynthesis protein FlhF